MTRWYLRKRPSWRERLGRWVGTSLFFAGAVLLIGLILLAIVNVYSAINVTLAR
jgi:hypothetical protein